MSSQSLPTWRERLTSPLAWHYAGLAFGVVLLAAFSIRIGLDWSATDGALSGMLASKQIQLKVLDLQAAHLRGIDKRVAVSNAKIDAFYATRIPASYSSIASRVGEIEIKSGAHLSGVTFTQEKPGSDLTEISMDVGISGEYPQIMRFVNGLERDQTFFLIRTMALMGQQAGVVNLRLRVSTWLRTADASASSLPPAPATRESSPAISAPGKEGE